MRRCRGFTLIEVMIVVAIVGILAAIALPAYGEYITRSRITEALSTLSGQRVKMEQYFQDNRKYAGACTSALAAMSPGKYFGFECATPSDNTYTITARGTGTMAGFVYSLDQTNAQTTTGVSPNGWSLGTGTCWVLKKDGSC